MTNPKIEKAAGEHQPKQSLWAKVRNFFVKPTAGPEKIGEEKEEGRRKKEEESAAGAPAITARAPEVKAAASEALKIKATEGATAPTAASTPAALPIVVKFSKVTKSFGHGAAVQVALQDVSFTVEDLPDTGELISIVGPSGCGKSTLLRMIAGLEPPYPQTGGMIEILGKTGNLLPSWERGLVDQKYSLFPHLTVRQNIMFGLDIRGESRSTRGDKADLWIKKVGLEGNEDKYPQELYGGMQQRVAIAATLVLGPRILLMDEPFGALDPKTRLRMQELLVQLWNEQQSTVFIVTHSVEEALYLGDRVFRLAARPGRLVEILKAPRPDVPPEVMRQKPWFVD